MIKKVIILCLIFFNLNFFLLANSTFDLGVDANLNDIGLSLNNNFKNLNVKATISYPLFSILEESDKFDQASFHDFFETICFHGTINYNIINLNNFSFNFGLASDVFMQFDFSNIHTHYTCFSIGPIGELSCLLPNKVSKKNIKLALSLSLPLIILENKPTNSIEPTEEEGWNQLIDYNYALFYMVKMLYKVSLYFPI